MSEVATRRVIGANISLRQLLTVNAMIAIAIAVGLAYRNNRSLTQQRDELLTLAIRLQVKNTKELASVAKQKVVNGFQTWQVYVPEDQEFDLRLGIGNVSNKGIPPLVGSVRIPPGQHRVTLYSGASISEKFRYVVYLDGEQVIEKEMGGDWMPDGWSMSSSVPWARKLQEFPAPLQLASQWYEPKHNFGKSRYFNGQHDSHVTRLGYRLWIDQTNRTYQPASPFVGFPDDPRSFGIGLRDGLRFSTSTPSFPWTFTRPQLAATGPVLQLEADFVKTDGTVLPSTSPSLQSWQVCNAATGTELLQWHDDPSLLSQTAYLRALSKSGDDLQPVVEMKWEFDKPDEMGFRLADTPANEQIKRWQLHFRDGSQHLWRELKMNDRGWFTPDQSINESKAEKQISEKLSTREVILDFGDNPTTKILQWQTNEKLPLQILERENPSYAGMGLYRGLLPTISIRIPATLKPTLAVDVADQHRTFPGTAMPGGPVFNEIRIELEASQHDWIWLSVKMKQPNWPN
jgi:hypothetical protein